MNFLLVITELLVYGYLAVLFIFTIAAGYSGRVSGVLENHYSTLFTGNFLLLATSIFMGSIVIIILNELWKRADKKSETRS